MDLSDSNDLTFYVTQPGDYGGFNDEDVILEGDTLFPPVGWGHVTM